jgi:DUF2075 family protein
MQHPQVVIFRNEVYNPSLCSEAVFKYEWLVAVYVTNWKGRIEDMLSMNVGRGFCCQLFDLDYVSLILPTREIANFSLIE